MNHATQLRLPILLLLATLLAFPFGRSAAAQFADPFGRSAAAQFADPFGRSAAAQPADAFGRSAAAQHADPFAYCAAVGTVDRPDSRWTGPPVPDAVIEGLIRAAGLPEDVPRDQLRRSTFWRCMDGEVYACFVGANLPCQAKADTRRIPTAAMWRFCRANPGADNIPAVVTGRATVYQWRCTGRRPTIVRQVDAPDARGFLKRIWYRITPQ